MCLREYSWPIIEGVGALEMNSLYNRLAVIEAQGWEENHLAHPSLMK